MAVVCVVVLVLNSLRQYLVTMCWQEPPCPAGSLKVVEQQDLMWVWTRLIMVIDKLKTNTNVCFKLVVLQMSHSLWSMLFSRCSHQSPLLVKSRCFTSAQRDSYSIKTRTRKAGSIQYVCSLVEWSSFTLVLRFLTVDWNLFYTVVTEKLRSDVLRKRPLQETKAWHEESHRHMLYITLKVWLSRFCPHYNSVALKCVLTHLHTTQTKWCRGDVERENIFQYKVIWSTFSWTMTHIH